jgi:tetratricopeptide (TPR) repeat protein
MLDSSLLELRRLLGNDHEDVRSALGDLLMVTADSNARRALLGEVIAFERRLPSKDSLIIAGRLNREGSIRHESSRFEEAAFFFQGALDMLEARLPPDHEAVRTVRGNLATALASAGRFARAESLQRAALAIEDRLKGSGPGRAAAREALAITLLREGRADQAEDLERQAYALFREALAPSHWRVWSAARNLGFIASARGRVEAGLALIDTAIAIAGRGGNESREAVGYLTAQRVPFLLRLKRVAEATTAAAEAERLLGTSSAVSVDHRADVNRYAGMAAFATGDRARAVERFQEAVALTTAPDRSPSGRGINGCLLGVSLASVGRLEEASPLVEARCARYLRDGIPDPMIVEWIGAARARVAHAKAAANDSKEAR